MNSLLRISTFGLMEDSISWASLSELISKKPYFRLSVGAFDGCGQKFLGDLAGGPPDRLRP